MKAQQAPGWPRHSAEVAAVKCAWISPHSMIGGIVAASSQIDRMVRMAFSGEENSRSRTQAIGPVCEIGGAMDSVVLAILPLHQRYMLVVPVHEEIGRAHV